MNNKNIFIRVSERLKKQAEDKAKREEKNLSEYIRDLLVRDLKEN